MQINFLEKINNYDKPIGIINANFEALRRSNNDIDERLSNIETSLSDLWCSFNAFRKINKEGVMTSAELVMLLNNIAQLFYEKDKQITELKTQRKILINRQEELILNNEFGTECIKGE